MACLRVAVSSCQAAFAAEVSCLYQGAYMSSTVGIRAHIVMYQYDKIVQLAQVLRIHQQNIFECWY